MNEPKNKLFEVIKNAKSFLIAKVANDHYSFSFAKDIKSPDNVWFTFNVKNKLNEKDGSMLPEVICTDNLGNKVQLIQGELGTVFEEVVKRRLENNKGLNSVMTLASIHYKDPNIPLFLSKIGKTKTEAGTSIDMQNNLSNVVEKAVINAQKSGKSTASVLIACSWFENGGMEKPEQHMVTMTVNCDKFDSGGKLLNGQKLSSEDCLIFDNSGAIRNLPLDIKGQFESVLDCGENGNISKFYPNENLYYPNENLYINKTKETICFECAKEAYIKMSESKISIFPSNNSKNIVEINSITSKIISSIRSDYKESQSNSLNSNSTQHTDSPITLTTILEEPKEELKNNNKSQNTSSALAALKCCSIPGIPSTKKSEAMQRSILYNIKQKNKAKENRKNPEINTRSGSKITNINKLIVKPKVKSKTLV